MDIRIIPGPLSGTITTPPSKSAAHRALICALLADGKSQLTNLGTNDDIIATMNAAITLGAQCNKFSENTLEITGIQTPPQTATIDCNESGSTFRFFVPIAAALGVKTTFLGRGELPNRPMEPLIQTMKENGIRFSNTERKDEIFTIDGSLSPGIYEIPGNISSQYLTGLLFSLPLLRGSSEIHLTTPLESSAYVDMTLDTLKRFGVSILQEENVYFISKNNAVKPSNFTVEGDYSGGAFWLSANAIGSDIKVLGLAIDSLQGDRAVLKILNRFSNHNKSARLSEEKASLSAIEIDATEIPDLVPILAVVATQAIGTTKITGASRLRIKESDRLLATAQGLNRLGAQVKEFEDGLIIKGPSSLQGGTVSSFGDHRIAMAMSIAATVASSPVTITGAECISKSYPEFYEDFKALGGVFHVLSMG